MLLLDVCGNNLHISIKLFFKLQIYKVSQILTHLSSKASQILSLIGTSINYSTQPHKQRPKKYKFSLTYDVIRRV